MKRGTTVKLVVGCLSSFVLLGVMQVRAQDESRRHDDEGEGDNRAKIGFQIAPVPLQFRERDRQRVGVGSYLVNAVGSCQYCHSCPAYVPGHNPYGPPLGPPGGGDGEINTATYLAGGQRFGANFFSPNLTPDLVTGLPAGNHTFQDFESMLRTGHDPDRPDHILQVMPWPIFRKMSDDDLRAIYAYLKAIPHAEPGKCFAPDQ